MEKEAASQGCRMVPVGWNERMKDKGQPIRIFCLSGPAMLDRQKGEKRKMMGQKIGGAIAPEKSPPPGMSRKGYPSKVAGHTRNGSLSLKRYILFLTRRKFHARKKTYPSALPVMLHSSLVNLLYK